MSGRDPIDSFAEAVLPPPGVETRSGMRCATMSHAGSLGPVLGRLEGFNLLEQPVVAGIFDRPGLLFAARTCVGLRREMIGRQVVLAFDASDLERPVILGVVQAEGAFALDVEDREASQTAPVVTEDAGRLLISAERQIVLRCGDASITLTRAGKILIEGRYIVSRSSGCNKLKGAAIEIN